MHQKPVILDDMKRFVIIALVIAMSVTLIVYGITSYLSSAPGHFRWAGGTSWRARVTDPPAPALTVRMLDVGQGDATYIHNGESRILIDGGPDAERFGALLDSLGLNGSTIDVVVITHQHYDHYNGLRTLFDSRRHIKVRYVFENKDASTASSLAELRDSIIARISRDSLVYRDTDDPCDTGAPVCSIAMRGGAVLHIMRPLQQNDGANNRSAAIKLVGPDSASFTMWIAGDAEHDAIRHFEQTYAHNPGMHVDVLKADHHGSCNGVTAQYLEYLQPRWVIASLAAQNDYGHMHEQAKAAYRAAGVPWYRTDQNGTITIRSPGTPSGGYTVTPSHGATDLSGPSDRRSRQQECAGM